MSIAVTWGARQTWFLGVVELPLRVAHIWTNLVRRYVLPNHHLFTVAERSPSNAAQLLALFSHGGAPPVLRRRAGELADVIKTTVERMTYSRAAVEAVEVTTDVKMVDLATSPEVAAVEEISKSRLWGSVKVTSASALRRTPSSSLFGARSTVAHEKSPYSTSQSSLFSTASSHSPPQVSRPTYLHIHVIQTLFQISTPIISSSGKKFLDLVARIHRTLVIAPTTPMVNQTLC